MYFKDLELYQSKSNKNLIFSCKDLSFYFLNDEYTDELNRFTDLNHSNSSVIEKLNSIESKDKEIQIDSLKLIIANSCNMNCRYCYASGGNYGRENDFMSRDIATSVIEFVKGNNIKKICFFGGEPLLGFDIIKYICDSLKDSVSYLIQTNGTILNEEIIHTFKKYNFDVTVSIDGYKKINDMNRVLLNGNGSYDIISGNIDKMLERGINISVLEATVTDNTKDIDSFSNIEKFLKNRFNVSQIQIGKDVRFQEIYDDRGYDDLTSINDIYKELKENKIKDLGVYKDPIDHIVSQKYESYFCGAGSEQITIDSNGDIYICPMFIDKNNSNKTKFNIQRDNIINLKEYTKKYKKSGIKKCEKCIAKFNCSMCIAVDKDLTKDECRERKKNTEESIEYLMNLILNDQYNDFVKIYSKVSGRFI